LTDLMRSRLYRRGEGAFFKPNQRISDQGIWNFEWCLIWALDQEKPLESKIIHQNLINEAKSIWDSSFTKEISIHNHIDANSRCGYW
jgi:hypothetical protein